MSNSSVFTRPQEMTREEIQNLIKEHQEKVRWFEKELVGIKLTFKNQRLPSQVEVKELKRRRRTLGMWKERYQQEIRELKKRGVELHTIRNES